MDSGHKKAAAVSRGRLIGKPKTRCRSARSSARLLEALVDARRARLSSLLALIRIAARGGDGLDADRTVALLQSGLLLLRCRLVFLAFGLCVLVGHSLLHS